VIIKNITKGAENAEESHHLEDIGIERTILRRILRKYCGQWWIVVTWLTIGPTTDCR
jgi:hypothetical protein